MTRMDWLAVWITVQFAIAAPINYYLAKLAEREQAHRKESA